ncbi:actin ARP9 [Fusarium tjaetaba]|uniref:Actin ARP9 n=1 Tax=Fusarium tjaetaba TaxID=1567544 RepID=A0A8H5R6B3_9HYPO|nr:actin ARP9 [Fusarium tjaetaba]KAF5627330.1 actin ARP9 [Fusarium tjaetaba]
MAYRTPTKQRRDQGGHVHHSAQDAATPATLTPVASSSARYQLRARKPREASPTPTPTRRNNGSVTPSPHKYHNHYNYHYNNSLDLGASARKRNRTMSSTAGKWREEQVLIICPGSRTTMAQLGCSELTPPARRMPTRMFKEGDQWAPYHKTKRTTIVNGVEEEEWLEDVDEDEGAVYPIEAGRIVNMSALLAFLDHVHGLLTTTYHNTPIMLMASPQWTRPDCETIARYVFENTRTPALCIIHSGIATQYGLKWPNLTVVDIGYQKVDVTAIHDGRVVNHMDVSASDADGEISGGEVFTKSLLKLLENKGFNHEMAEQLKKSNICEVLPYVATEENLMELPTENTAGATGGQPASAIAEAAPKAPEAPKPTDNGDADEGNGNPEDDGVLDVAAIVTSGQTKEFLAKKEKEKEKGKGGRKKGEKDAEGAAKAARLPNSKRTHNTFFYEEIIQEEVPQPSKEKETLETAAATTNGNGTTEAPKPEGETNGAQPQPQADNTAAPAPAAETETPAIEAPKPEQTQEPAQSIEPKPEAEPKPDAQPSSETPEKRPKRIRRDVEVGLERFTFAQRREIDRIVNAIYRTVQGIDDMYMRPPCWDNLVFVGNGARLRGLRENILQTLNARHLVSPSTATMFTSELPSNMATPTGTGAQTPTGSFTGAPHQLSSSGVNPLLQAATTAAAAGTANTMVGTPQPASEAGGPTTTHHFHSQTPTSIKTATLPNYLSEWTKNGFEESMFLGAQVAARIAFCLHSNMDAQTIEAQRLMSLSRVDYNELGPKGIRTHSMLG